MEQTRIRQDRNPDRNLSDDGAAAKYDNDDEVDAGVEAVEIVGEKLPLPTVSYDWSDSPAHGTTSSRLPSYLPKSGYS